jgi:hypothetical protein
MKILPICYCTIILFFFHLSQAQTFTDVTPADFSTLPVSGNIAWGDLDNDGQLDLIYMGTTESMAEAKLIVLKNQGTSFQTAFESSELGVAPSTGSMDNLGLADLDNDGDLDIVACGKAFRIIRNLSNFTFEDADIQIYWSVEAADFPSSVYLGDEDGNGQPDILTTARYVWNLWLNQNLNFNEQKNLVDELGWAYLYQRWADMDSDGDLDILMSRGKYGDVYTGSDFRNFLMIRQPDDSFERNPQSASTQYLRHVEFSDFDSDGDLDVLAKDSPDAYSVFRNDNMTLVNTGVTLPLANSAKWADFNNDSSPDIILTGPETRILYNDGNGSFTDSSISSLPAFDGGKIAVGDYDHDGDPDFSLVGERAGRIFRNEWIENGNPPLEVAPIPTQLLATPSYNSVRLQWASGVGSVPGNSYNLSVTSADGSLVLPLNLASDQATPTLYAEGNVGGTKQYLLKGLTAGIYHWRVQEVNGSFHPSAFSPTSTFEVVNNPNAPTDFTNFVLSDNQVRLTWVDKCSSESGFRISVKEDIINPEYRLYSIAPSNTTSTILKDLKPDTKYVFKIEALGCDVDYENPVETTGKTFPQGLEKVISLLPDVKTEGTVLAAGDYDNDRDLSFADINNDSNLDMLVAGTASLFNKATIHLFINIGDNKFIDSGIDFGKEFLIASAYPWIDYDNDGFKDILVSRRNNSCGHMALIKNHNGDSLSVQQIVTDVGIHDADLANNYKIADFDNDGFEDFAISGLLRCESEIAYVYRNEGEGLFTRSGAQFEKDANTWLAWGDINNDGYTDLSTYGTSSRIYLNNPTGDFSAFQTKFSKRVKGGSVLLADIDNDNDLDYISFGMTTVGGHPIIETYRNGFGNGWGVVNQPPPAPEILPADIISKGKVQLKWMQASDDKSQLGVSYNLYLINGSDTVIQANSLADGYRKVARIGNVHSSRSFTMTHLVPGKYKWAVQAIDQAYVGGPFSQQGAFELTGHETEPPVVTGLNEESMADVMIYPNPIENDLNIETISPVDIRVWDLMGKAIMSVKCESNVTLHVRDWKPGVYIIEYRSNTRRVQRFIKK